MAEEIGLEIDEEAFEKARSESKEASKGGKKSGGNGLVKLDVHSLAHLDSENVIRTDDSFKYLSGNIESTIVAIYTENKFVDSISSTTEQQVGLLLDKTNFYAEQGGQEYDTGKIVIDGQSEFEVENVQAYSGYVLHTGYLKYGDLKVSDKVIAGFDELRRWPIRNNHTGTHVLNYALKETLGNSVEQKGSLVAPGKLRFDFSNKQALSLKEVEQVENISNDFIKQNLKVYTKDVALSLAKKINGVRAVFGETYPDPVRVVSVGEPVEILIADPSNIKWTKISVEFCGGTHVNKTGDIKELVITEESGIAKGIRRIVAVTGVDAYEVQKVAKDFDLKLDALDVLPLDSVKESKAKQLAVELSRLSVSVLEKNKLNEKFTKIQKKIMEELKKKQRLESKKAVDSVTSFFTENENALYFVYEVKEANGNAKALSEALNHVKSKLPTKSVYLFSADSEKVAHGCYIAEQTSSKGLVATELGSVVTKIIGGRSGGKGSTIQGSGIEVNKVSDAISELEKLFKEKLDLIDI
jgi:alanyl-tRNA synthetase